MGKKKNRQGQQSAQLRGYREAMREVNGEVQDISDTVYNIRLLIETSRIMSMSNVLDRLDVVQERLNELVNKTEVSSMAGKRMSILDLQNDINISTGEDPSVPIIDDKVVNFLLTHEFDR